MVTGLGIPVMVPVARFLPGATAAVAATRNSICTRFPQRHHCGAMVTVPVVAVAVPVPELVSVNDTNFPALSLASNLSHFVLLTMLPLS